MRGTAGGRGGGRSNYGGNYTNPCLTMHQPWASLLVYGIKRIEGRSWPCPVRGRLWIHAASKVPDEDTIKLMENFYREIYAVNGIIDIQFPQHYPVSRLLGCVEVVGCVRKEELASWEAIPRGARLEALTDFCWLCEQPQKLLVPFEMRGYQGVYNLERKIYEAAVRGLTQVKAPLPVKFPLPNPHDPFSLEPGSISLLSLEKASEVEKSSNLTAAIAGARAAATQFNRKDQNLLANTVQDNSSSSARNNKVESRSVEQHNFPENNSNEVSHDDHSLSNETDQSDHNKYEESTSRGRTREVAKRQSEVPAKIFAAALRGLKPS